MSRHPIPLLLVALAAGCAEETGQVPAADVMTFPSVYEPGYQRLYGDRSLRELDAQAMVDCFRPLHDWPVEQNRGRTHTRPEL